MLRWVIGKYKSKVFFHNVIKTKDWTDPENLTEVGGLTAPPAATIVDKCLVEKLNVKIVHQTYLLYCW